MATSIFDATDPLPNLNGFDNLAARMPDSPAQVRAKYFKEVYRETFFNCYHSGSRHRPSTRRGAIN